MSNSSEFFFRQKNPVLFSCQIKADLFLVKSKQANFLVKFKGPGFHFHQIEVEKKTLPITAKLAILILSKLQFGLKCRLAKIRPG